MSMACHCDDPSHGSRMAGALEGFPLVGGCDNHPNGLPLACQFSSSKGSIPVNGNSKVSFLYMVEASCTATSLNLRINSTSVASARDCTRLLAAARQQVSLSSRPLCPILLRQIPQNHHGIDARTPHEPRPRACGFLTHDCHCLVCTAFWASAEPTPRRRLLASYSTDVDDFARNPCELFTLHALLSQLFGRCGRGKERSLSACAGLPSGPSLASHRHGSVVQWGCSYDSFSHWLFMGMC